MFSRFFINRPIFAVVVSVVIIMAGLVTIRTLPVTQYPEITPPRVRVQAVYPGASAKVLASTVAQPIEEQVNGVDGMIYMSSTSTNNGEYTLTVSFEVGTDVDLAQVLVQNRVSQAEALLPEEVQRMGVTVAKQSDTILQFVSLNSPDERYSDLYLGNYAKLYIRDQLMRLTGVGNVMVFGSADYSMRIWLDPERMKARGLTTNDVVSAIREQNVQVAAGQLGQLPVKGQQAYQYALNVKGQLEDISDFENIIVKSLSDNRMVRVKDIARVELGGESYNWSTQTNGKDSANIGIFPAPGGNALEISRRVQEKMEELSKEFPPGMEYSIPFDATKFVDNSIREVVDTLLITVILVVLVILVFLQNWRASLIPVVTIPVSLIGTLAVMSVLGISINLLSLFGIVLAVGIVVDDAIVVVENVIRHIDENNMPPKEAAILTMKEVTGPVIATTLVLLSVFVPTAFMEGTTGQLYRQFALTIATATVFSTINALTLSPALSAILLKGVANKKLNIFARGFNRFFDWVQVGYGAVVAALLRRTFIVLILFAGIAGATFYGFIDLPKGFVPNEDQGWAMVVVQLPDASSLNRTQDVVDIISQKLDHMESIQDYVGVPGYSVFDSSSAPNAAVFWVIFDPWEKRLKKGFNLERMMGQLWMAVAPIEDAQIFAFPPPPILGLGMAGGFNMQVQDRAHKGLDVLQQETFKLMMAANQTPELERVFSTFRANVPQLEAIVDREKVKSMGLRLSDVYETLQVNLGSVYVNDFSKFGKNYQVRVQADSEFRSTADNITKLEVRHPSGSMVPLGAVLKVADVLGPQTVTRYNMYPSARLNGQGVLGVSSGQAMALMEALSKKTLPQGIGVEWTDMSYQEQAAKGSTIWILLMSIVFVYLVLCAQYESWTLPLSVILSIPLAIFGTVSAVYIRGMDINIYTQIGLVLLVALSCKTAILITEFAKASRDEGQSIFDAALTASKVRFRPILMTAFTFILGMIPLVYATGAGANSQQALGTGVFAGMLSATLLLIFVVPVFYMLIQTASEKVIGRFSGKARVRMSQGGALSCALEDQPKEEKRKDA